MKKQIMAAGLSLLLAASVLPGTAGATKGEQLMPEEIGEVFSYRTEPDKDGIKWLMTEQAAEYSPAFPVGVPAYMFMDTVLTLNGERFYWAVQPGTEYFFYDNAGNLLNETWSVLGDDYPTAVYTPNQDGTLSKVTSYEYWWEEQKEDGSPVTNPDGTPKISYTSENTTCYFYDKDGYLTGIGSDANNLSRSWTYDKNHRLASSESWGLTTTYAYHADGTCSSESRNSDGEITGKATYDEHGNMVSYCDGILAGQEIKEDQYQTRGNSREYTYDSHNNLTHAKSLSRSIIYLDSEKLLPSTGDSIYETEYSYKYDSEGNILQEKRIESRDDVQEEYSSTYTYDENGKVLTIHEDDPFSPEGRDIKCTYDQYGNLTQVKILNAYAEMTDDRYYDVTLTMTYTPFQTDPDKKTGALGENGEIPWTYSPAHNNLLLNDEDVSKAAPVVAAGYTKDGKMLFSLSITEPTSVTPFPQKADHYKLFWLDADGKPRCDCVTIRP